MGVEGTVLRSINNIYSVKTADGVLYSTRIKGKRLSALEGEYNPIVAGDRVLIEPNPSTDENTALLTERLERVSFFSRWNVKKQLNQTICANMDVLVCICAALSPPFRPRFIDRVIACTQGVPVLICMNKCDILLTEEEFERFKLYSSLGYAITSVSAKTGENIDRLKALLKGKTAAFIGQSGVGKSSLVNALLGSRQRIGEVSDKYNRGCHTTNHALMIEGDDFTLIDTPGFREIAPPHDNPLLVQNAFPEFKEYECEYESCMHMDEDGCAVKDALSRGLINPDRYLSYVNIVEDMKDRLPSYHRKSKK